MLNRVIFFIHVFLTAICPGLVTAQTPEQNHAKYWYYRHRLLNDFMLVGEGLGMSIPAERRGPYWANTSTGDVLRFGADETANMGGYIAVLATEIKLLKDKNQDASGTIRELYYALKAINRLDENAEYYNRLPDGSDFSLPPQPQPGDLNGFFVRSDMPVNFVANNMEHFNGQNYGKGNSSITVNKNHSSLQTDDFSCRRSAEESQDQIINLMIGMAMVSEFVNDTYNGMDLNKEARDITHRMVMHLKNNNWIVKNPVTGEQVGGGANHAGGNAVTYSYGLAQAACHIVRDPSGFFNATVPIACFKYHDAITVGVSYLPFQLMKWFLKCPVGDTWASVGLWGIDELPCKPCQEMWHPEVLAAIGDCYYKNMGTGPVKFNVTGPFLSTQASSTDMEITPLIHQTLHGGVNVIKKSRYETLLNGAPCGGPYNFGDCHYETYEWSSPVRWRQSDRRGMGCPDEAPDPDCSTGWYGEYNGLDYMLLFNLYSIVRGNTNNEYISSFVNLMDRRITLDFPIPFLGPDLGSHTKPVEIDAFNIIVADNTIHTDGSITYRAGRDIELLPGFGVEAGADFSAYVDNFECGSGGYIRPMSGDTTDITYFNEPTSNVYYSDGSGSPHYLDLSLPVSFEDELVPEVEASGININPNPTNGIFTVSILDGQSGEIFIYNNIGHLVYRQLINATQVLDLSSQPLGIYILKVQTADNVFNEKLVVR